MKKIFNFKSGLNNKTIRYQRYIISGLAVFAAFLSLVIFLKRAPEFPETIPAPSHKQLSGQERENRNDLFDIFNSYLKKHHGFLVKSSKFDEVISLQGSKGEQYPLFKQEFEKLNRELFLNLVNSFSKEHNLKLNIKETNLKKNSLETNFEVYFLKEEKIWLAINIETEINQQPDKIIRPAGARLANKVIISKQENIEKIDFTAKTEELKTGDNNLEKSAPDKIEQSTPIIDSSSDLDKNNLTRAKLVLVVTNFGRDPKVSTNFLNLNTALTFAILPKQKYSAKIAEMVHNQGRDILLQMPMQPKSWPKINPGTGALLVEDSPGLMQKKMVENSLSVPYSIGVNNFMGSAFSEQKEAMELIMSFLKNRKLFYLDSRTAPIKIPIEAAQKLKVNFLARDILLNMENDEESIRDQLYKAVKLALKNGTSIVIANNSSQTYQVLSEDLPILKTKGIEVVSISSLIK